ncbi:cilium assembly protein DZIP1 [Ostrinia nubilalis]|uniref:cilium assembly protein DZIP1 n=1 Tax=Ostrinia nubilalis TaxID=29057 RepID=UPI0030823D2B
MACKTSYELHHNFAKIADEAGFAFNNHRPRIHIDWNKIRLIDIDSLIREKKFVLIEQHVNDILDCVLESEFDVRILDEGVLKMFRLAQLAVEYQQFCRHYLDRSVYVLREEITSLAQELDSTKKELRDRDEEIRKLKRKTKHTYRTPLPYGNDNIASMILKTLSQKNELFSYAAGDVNQYNKCNFCDKVFLNQLYLKSHISRRHSNIMEMPQRDTEDSSPNQPNITENTKLRDEILELKLKLKEMESAIKQNSEQANANVISQNKVESITENDNKTNTVLKQTKDVKVATNNEDYLLDKIEEWKKGEQDKYHKEIDLLRSQIMDTIKSIKDKETPVPNTELKIIEQLNITISKQGAEILALKQELINSRSQIEKEDAERRKESETQMALWTNRAETHAKQYESLVQKLNEVATEAQESRAQADAERRRVAQLEDMLQQSIKNSKTSPQKEDLPKSKLESSQKDGDVKKTPMKKKAVLKTTPEADRETLKKLHQKAQALLNMGSFSTSSSEDLSVENAKSPKPRKTLKDLQGNKMPNHKTDEVNKVKPKLDSNHLQRTTNTKNNHDSHNNREIKGKKTKSKSLPNKIEKNGTVIVPGSPMKILRAKITEEVNNRLISAGVDPLKSSLPKFDYQKRKMQLQQEQEMKAKENPTHEKVRHSILAYLDSKVPRKIVLPPQDYVSPNKISKPFSFTSVISNVKSKALSLVKSNDVATKDKRKTLNAEVARRVMTLLNTPPDSGPSTPVNKHVNYVTTESQIESNSESRHVSVVKKRHNSNATDKTKDKTTNSARRHSVINTDTDSDSESSQNEHKYHETVVKQCSKSIENLIKSPARRPLSASSDYKDTVKKYTISEDNLFRSQSATNISNSKADIIVNSKPSHEIKDNSTDVESSDKEEPLTKDVQSNPKQTKGVLKNASSTSSLNKKKVLFDMEAIQMKSLSASPSQSLTEKSDGNEKYELGLINLDGEEWDISSIENEPLKNDTKLQLSSRTSPKIAELTKTIESQLARRNDTPSTAIVGGIDVLAPAPLLRASSIAGSNTSLGSSILDDSESPRPVVNNKAFVKPKLVAEKDDSEIDLSEFSTSGIVSNKNERDAF